MQGEEQGYGRGKSEAGAGGDLEQLRATLEKEKEELEVGFQYS